MIELISVTKTYNSGKAGQFTALRKANLLLQPGQTAVFNGPSGSGKTTLLSIIGCMTRPTSGRLKINGREAARLPEHFLSRLRRDTFGFVFQSFNLINGMSVAENVMLPAYPTNLPHRQIRQRDDPLSLSHGPAFADVCPAVAFDCVRGHAVVWRVDHACIKLVFVPLEFFLFFLEPLIRGV